MKRYRTESEEKTIKLEHQVEKARAAAAEAERRAMQTDNQILKVGVQDVQDRPGQLEKVVQENVT